MNELLSRIDRLFADAPIARDTAGLLSAAAEVVGDLQPVLAFVADENGRVELGHDLGSGADIDAARALMPPSPGDAEITVFANESALGRGHVFLVRPERGQPGLSWGALLAVEDDPTPVLCQRLAALRACGRLLTRAVQCENKNRSLQTHVDHLLAEHEMLKWAHTEAAVAAVEEQEKRLEHERERLAAEQQCAATEAANRAKSQFLANMSHEIRTPLTAILGFTELLRSGADGSEAERREYLDNVYESAAHLLELINDVLDLSKIEAGRMQIENVAYSPNEIVSSIISVMRVRAREKGLKLTVEWPHGVPATIQTDPLRLKQLLMNLVGNALKFTQHGSVRLVCRLVPHPARPQIAFDVIDTGVGIAADKLESIFDAFVQADNSVTRQFGGTGLGLAISRRIARALGGDILVKSEFGKGSTFTAVIDTGPLENVVVLSAPPSDAVAPRAEESCVRGSEMLAGKRLLLVEDGTTNRKLISLILRRAGIEVVTAENGREGLDAGSHGGFDVILMDMQMPVMDGYTATQQLRALGLTMPIIALTAHAMAGDEQKCQRAGCTAYLSKPVKADVLLAKIVDVLASVASPLDASNESAHARKPATAVEEDNVEDDGPILSTLPLDDPEFREIVDDFLVLLDEMLDAVQAASAAGDYAEIACRAHTLKGTAGAAGFDALTAPSKRLELAARSRNNDDVREALETLEGLAARIGAPAAADAHATAQPR